ncbi:MAG TPA: alpha-amylase family glycosyl hydrolase [Cyclobacteriaceae bacterium]|nr:alpha-amylase family glycosyl hydrolase [Cyclobacteriaceae bacterium]
MRTRVTDKVRLFYSTLSFLIIMTLANGCNSSDQHKVVTWPHGVYYEIFVQSFYDSNGDGIGDINGLTQKLDYIQDLGVNGVWLMPIMPSPSYHKYDVTDYKGIHPDYGTVEDFKKFVDEAHKRDLKVIIDLIMNHCSMRHPWFVDAVENPKGPYRDYFLWADKDSIANEIAKKTTTLDSDNITQWHAVEGDEKGEHYYGFFNRDMPDLNFDNPAVRKEFVEIGRYWFEDMKVDGFRLDAAKHIYPDDRAPDNHAFWAWFRGEMEKIKPDVYMVGEVWSPAEEVAPYLKGIPALFNFDLGVAIINAVNAEKDTNNLVKTYKTIADYYHGVTPEYLDATFLTNHDQNRIMSVLGNDPKKMRVAVALLMTLPGTPYIYYGEELGMLGMKPDEHIREPFVWDKGNAVAGQASWITPEYSTDQTISPLSIQTADEGSLYNYYKNWIRLRNTSRALSYGELNYSDIKKKEIISFVREMENESDLIIHNISNKTASVKLPEPMKRYSSIYYQSDTKATIIDGQCTLPPYSTVILQPL